MTATHQSSYPLPIEIPNLRFYHTSNPFILENGAKLEELTIAYHTYGQLNAAGDNVLWVCHALTANSDVADWWSGIFGKGKILDPDKYFIVCANILGSCYGTTCPRSIHPSTGKAYGLDFPQCTIRDIVQAHDVLRQHLGIEQIALCLGGSCGAHQVLEFAYLQPKVIQKIALLVASSSESPWAIAIHETQRLAIEADATWTEDDDTAGAKGLQAARAVGLLSYRTIDAYQNTQADTDGRSDNFRASSYMRYQGEKLVRRFYAQCYWYLTKALDSHNIGRGRGGISAALQRIQMEAVVLSIKSDILIPPREQHKLAHGLPNARLVAFDSDYGHDGFLVEAEKVNGILGDFLN